MSNSTKSVKSKEIKKQVKTQPSITSTGNGYQSPAVKKHIQTSN